MRFFFTLFTLTSLLCSASAHAQGSLEVMPNYYYNISTVHTPDQKEGDFTIRLTSPAAVTGCMDVTAPKIEMFDAGAVLYATLTEGGVNTSEKRRYGQYDCAINAGQSFAEINLNKQKIEKNNTYKLEIKSDTVGRLYDINIKSSPHKVTLEAELKTPVMLPSQEKTTILEHWFYPENTVIIFIPGMHKNPDLVQKANALATNRGLTPLSDVYKDFPVSEANAKALYFVDTKNTLKDSFNTKDTIIFGNIKTTQTYQGANGPYEKAAAQAVFVRKPGLED